MQWAATFTRMNFVSGMPVLFGFAMYEYLLLGSRLLLMFHGLL
jgi:hypothetical protein